MEFDAAALLALARSSSVLPFGQRVRRSRALACWHRACDERADSGGMPMGFRSVRHTRAAVIAGLLALAGTSCTASRPNYNFEAERKSPRAYAVGPGDVL